MVQDTLVKHHKEIRKRIHQKFEPYPSPEKKKYLIDKLIYIVGILVPLMTIPQVLKIWEEQNATGVSIITWSVFFIASIFWLVYGIVHKEKPIIITNALFFVINLFVVIGVLIYG